MTPRANQRVRHRRSLTRRRAVVGGVAALGLTGALVIADSMQSQAEAAPSWPRPTAQQPVPKTIEVKAGKTHDGELKRYYGTGDLGDGGQGEGQAPLIKLQDGAVLKNVVIGSPAADGVHCMGSCTLKNVWWEDVGEDAASFKSKSAGATYTVTGGGARKADDKVFQFNGAGRLTISKFQVADFGKLVRSCGNCSKQYKRDIVVDDVDVTAPGGSIVGVNTNYNDTATLRKVRIHGDGAKKIKTCTRWTGNDNGDEPVQTGHGPDGKHCKFTAADISYH
ncbi:pectate lyase [Streptomyces longispororuber]|uniref:pectate lyase n=1 Tax=Streptomyces longispororuber TaxID=68230 RepID=UPI0033E7E6C3